MKPPVWIVNSLLFLLLLVTLVYIVIPRRKLPSPPSLRVSPVETAQEPTVTLVNQDFLRTIYKDNDLFGTYLAKPLPPKKEEEEILLAPPPTFKPFVMPQPIIPQFLEPLKIRISGIITSTNDEDTRVILSDIATKQEQLYRIGDKILDAHILRIFPDRVMFMRANGQQETLFVTAEEAQAQQKLLSTKTWDDVVIQESNSNFRINILSFVDRVTSLAQFFELLNLTSVYNKGEGVGCRIGKVSLESLAYALGFHQGDIITTINNIPAVSTHDRMKIFSTIKSLPVGSTLQVDVLRNNKKLIMLYTLNDTPLEKSTSQKQEPIRLASNHLQDSTLVQQQAVFVQEKQTHTSAVEDIRKRDKRAMMRYGNQGSLLQNIPL